VSSPADSRIGWLHCFAGASGDMLLGAVIGAGAPVEMVQAAVDAVGVEPVVLRVEPTSRHGLAATRVVVDTARSELRRSWADIRDLLERAELAPVVRAVALDAFARLARAEAAAHGGEPDDVHFHEVGALDAIADVVGTAAGLHALGLDRLTASPVTLGLGRTRGEHGVLPVPGPAVLDLLAEAGAPVESGEAPFEMCTPTGAALLAATVSGWGGLPPMRVTAVGTGAGGRDPAELPNVLRLVVGESVPTPSPPGDTALVLAANVDDLDPRLWPDVLGRLLAAGASDAWLTPILMKKGRPAHTLSVLVADAVAEEVRRVVFTETSTIGLREHRVAKRALGRELATVDVSGRAVRVKIARLDGAVVSATPEYDDVVAAAAALGRPVKVVLAAAAAAAHFAGLAP